MKWWKANRVTVDPKIFQPKIIVKDKAKKVAEKIKAKLSWFVHLFRKIIKKISCHINLKENLKIQAIFWKQLNNNKIQSMRETFQLALLYKNKMNMKNKIKFKVLVNFTSSPLKKTNNTSLTLTTNNLNFHMSTHILSSSSLHIWQQKE